MSSIKAVAHATGMAQSSVSRILNGKPGYKYNEETRQKVIRAAAELGYQPNAAARMLKAQSTNLVGVAVHLTVSPYLNRLLIAVREELIARNYEPVLLDQRHLAGVPAQTVFPNLSLLAGILSLDLSIGQGGSEHYAKVRQKLPVVALYPVAEPEVDWVYTDASAGMELLVDHLVGLGHRRIVWGRVLLPESHVDYLKRAGWEKAVRRHGLEPGEAVQLEVQAHESVRSRAAALLSRLLVLQPRPTAVMCGSDEIALATLGELQRAGLRVPEDISVVGYDGIDFGAYSYPALTSVEQPVEKIAAAGVDRLQQLLQGAAPSSPHSVTIAPTLVVRDSSSQPPLAGA